jgi:hypothetical protein
MNWNDNPVVKRLVVIGLIFVLVILAVYCTTNNANAATVTATDTLEATYTPVQGNAIPSADGKTTRKCWAWYPVFNTERHDPLPPHALKYAYGEDVVACTNAAETKWVAVPTYDPYHYLGYWQYDGVTKNKGALGYGTIRLSTTWTFSIKGLVPRSPLVKCDFRASNHTAYCTEYS